MISFRKLPLVAKYDVMAQDNDDPSVSSQEEYERAATRRLDGFRGQQSLEMISHAFLSNRGDTIQIAPTFVIGLKTNSFGGWYAFMGKRAQVRRFTTPSMHADAVLESYTLILSGEESAQHRDFGNGRCLSSIHHFGRFSAIK